MGVPVSTTAYLELTFFLLRCFGFATVFDALSFIDILDRRLTFEFVIGQRMQRFNRQFL